MIATLEPRQTRPANAAARLFAVAAAFYLTLAMAASAVEPTKPPHACAQGKVEEANVGSVSDGRTVTLADGRMVSLVGLVIPRPSATRTDEHHREARVRLEKLIGGREVTLAPVSEPDRYGRIRAFLFVAREGRQFLIQSELLSTGQALAATAGLAAACARELRDNERTARNGKLGLWADPYYEKQAGNAVEILQRQGQFTIVEGKILSVRESGGMIYLNFGRRWTRDFTVSVLKRNERGFSSAGMLLKRLEGQVVRVRGWIEARGGPVIEATGPEQIEVVASR